MVLIMVFRPRGLIGHREPSIRLHPGRPRAAADERHRSPLIEVEHLTMRFGGLVAVDDVSFIGRPREITAIIGPNGAGKTTVFNCITGFYKPTVGRLLCAATATICWSACSATRSASARGSRAPSRTSACFPA